MKKETTVEELHSNFYSIKTLNLDPGGRYYYKGDNMVYYVVVDDALVPAEDFKFLNFTIKFNNLEYLLVGDKYNFVYFSVI